MVNWIEVVVVELVATVLSNLILIALGFLVAFVLIFVRWQRLAKLIGLQKKRKVQRVGIYLSRINVSRGGATYTDGQPAKFFGSALSVAEYQGVSRLLMLLDLPAFYQLMPQAVVNTIHKSGLLFPKFELCTAPAPKDLTPTFAEDILFFIGDHYFNSGSRHYLNSSAIFFQLNPNKRDVEIMRGSMKGHIITRQDDEEFAIVQKIYIAEENRFVFIFAGQFAENSTRGALHYFVENWTVLYNKFKSREFGICVRFPHHLVDSVGYEKGRIIYDVSE